eukprot:TRINITY_DN215_c0_g1_i1.p2 TRINITY_DN215_c0_g1~~TRINITY_DN215_c0_g1_i1.p2  ORF type:complete len:328 (+),score=53.57 TRINITY_DN215_c0_g1_i1:435-1418(+)
MRCHYRLQLWSFSPAGTDGVLDGDEYWYGGACHQQRRCMVKALEAPLFTDSPRGVDALDPLITVVERRAAAGERTTPNCDLSFFVASLKADNSVAPTLDPDQIIHHHVTIISVERTAAGALVVPPRVLHFKFFAPADLQAPVAVVATAPLLVINTSDTLKVVQYSVTEIRERFVFDAEEFLVRHTHKMCSTAETTASSPPLVLRDYVLRVVNVVEGEQPHVLALLCSLFSTQGLTVHTGLLLALDLQTGARSLCRRLYLRRESGCTLDTTDFARGCLSLVGRLYRELYTPLASHLLCLTLSNLAVVTGGLSLRYIRHHELPVAITFA